MKRLFTAALLATAVFIGAASPWALAPAQACEKHLHSHQDSSDTGSEATQKKP